MEQPFSIVTSSDENVNNSEVEEKEASNNNNNVKASVDELELLRKLEEANR